MFKSFRTYQLALQFHRECQGLTWRTHFKEQFERACLSIVLNLAEGAGRIERKDRRRFYRIAFGSLRECQALLEIQNQNTLLEKADVLAAHLYRLCQRC